MKNSKTIRIMHIINNLEIGGAEKMLVLLLKEFSKRKDVELYVVSLEGHGPLLDEIPTNVTVKNFSYNLFGKLSKFNPGIKFRVLSYVNQIKPDLIQGHLIKGEDIAKITGILTNIPVVITSHDIFSKPNLLSRLLNRFVKKYIAVSKVVAKHLSNNHGLAPNQIEIIPNAINTGLFIKGIKKFDIDNPVFIYIGRILKSKGIEDAINGIAKLRSDYPRLKFLVYGKEVHKSDINDLESLVIKEGYNFVKFMGPTKDVPSALKTGDVFVLPSKSEGFAISVLEAAAAKKPVVATRVGAIPEIVHDGVSGILVDINSPDQIFRACRKILDENLVEKYGDEAIKIAKNDFSLQKVSQQYVELYKESIFN